MKSLCKTVRVLALTFLATLSLMPKAYADMTITPTIVVFEGRDRFKDVTLINTSNEQKTYEVGWRFYRMLNEGLAPYMDIDDSLTEFDLSENIVYTPRRVTLAPGGKQKIKLALRRRQDLPAGEYRAHLAFKAVRAEEPVNAESDDDVTGEVRKLSAAVKINLGFSIPVVLNVGEPEVSADIKLLSLQRNQQSGYVEALVEVHRTGGPYGILGYLRVYNSQDQVVGEVSNAYVFSEADVRTFKIPLPKEELLTGESLRVALDYYDRQAGKPAYASIEIPLQK